MASILRHAAALALLLPVAATMGCPFHEETFHRDCATAKDCDDGNPCTKDVCTLSPGSTEGVCSNPNSPENTLCSPTSMEVCDGEGHCVECVNSADCETAHPTDPICDMKQHKCVSCTDGVKDGEETGVDCGGPDCGACLGAPCDIPAHMYGTCGDMTSCVSQSRNPDNICCSTPCNGICEGCATATTGMPDGTCGPVAFPNDPYMDCVATGTPMAGGCGKSPNTCACNDMVMDGSETDVDCGGGMCPGCGGGKKCGVDTDCGATTPACVNGTCCTMNCVGGCTGCNSTGQCVAMPGKDAPLCTGGLVCGSTLAFPCVGRAGASCAAANLGEDCLSGVCQASTHTCAKSMTGGACNMTSDCASGTCTGFVCM